MNHRSITVLLIGTLCSTLYLAIPQHGRSMYALPKTETTEKKVWGGEPQAWDGGVQTYVEATGPCPDPSAGRNAGFAIYTKRCKELLRIPSEPCGVWKGDFTGDGYMNLGATVCGGPQTSALSCRAYVARDGDVPAVSPPLFRSRTTECPIPR